MPTRTRSGRSRGRRSGPNPKTEGRSPKDFPRSKPQKPEHGRAHALRVWGFGFASDPGVRDADFQARLAGVQEPMTRRKVPAPARAGPSLRHARPKANVSGVGTEGRSGPMPR